MVWLWPFLAFLEVGEEVCVWVTAWGVTTPPMDVNPGSALAPSEVEWPVRRWLFSPWGVERGMGGGRGIRG